MQKIWDTAQALRLVYTLSGDFELEVERILPSELKVSDVQSRRGKCIIGVHIRRGDSCVDTVGSTGIRRECYPTSKYLNLAFEYHRENPDCRTLFVSSDDSDAVEEIKGLSRGVFKVLAANISRDKYAVKDASRGQNLIEKRAFSDPSLNRRDIILDAIADVVGLSRCDVIIGHLGESVFSQTALLLSFANSGVMPPFATINFPMCYYWHFWGGRNNFSLLNVNASDCL